MIYVTVWVPVIVRLNTLKYLDQILADLRAEITVNFHMYLYCFFLADITH